MYATSEININDVETTEIGQTYADGDMLVYIMAKSVKQSFMGDSDSVLELVKCTDGTQMWWVVIESGKEEKADKFDSSEEAVIYYVERAFGISA